MSELTLTDEIIARKSGRFTGLADRVWEYAELPCAEYQSARAPCEALEEYGPDRAIVSIVS